LEIAERRSGIALQKLPKCLRVIRGITVAVSARDDEQPLFLRQIHGLVFGHIHDLRPETALFRALGNLFRQTLRGARLTSKKNRQRLDWRRHSSRRKRHAARGVRVGEKSGEVSVEPEPLFLVKRSVFWNERYLSH